MASKLSLRERMERCGLTRQKALEILRAHGQTDDPSTLTHTLHPDKYRQYPQNVAARAILTKEVGEREQQLLSDLLQEYYGGDNK